MKNRFILRPIQKELSHLILAYNETFDEYSLKDLRYNALIGNYTAVFNEENPPNINLKYYRKEETKHEN